MRYANGLRIPDPFIWLRVGEGKKAKEAVLVSGLEYSRAKEEARRGTKVVLWEKVPLENIRKPTGRKRNLADIAAAALLAQNITEVMMPENAWAVHVETLREHGIRVRLQAPFFPARVIKTAEEIAAIKHTGLVTKKAFATALKILKESSIHWDDRLIWQGKPLTSERMKEEIEKVFLAHGCASGESIVSCGEQAAQPHNRGSGPLYAGQPIVFDIFPRDLSSGYYFDMSRTVIKGTPTEELRKLYETVRKSQLAGIAAIKPGVKTSDVHRACAEVFRKAGYATSEEEGFIHSTGHGVGLDIHERPGLGEKSDEVLAPGMVVTVEPGLYYKELGGVRIEDTVVVSARGCTNLTNVPKIFFLR